MSSGPTTFEISKDSRTTQRSSTFHNGAQPRNSNFENSKRFSERNGSTSGKKDRRAPPVSGARRRGGGSDGRNFEATDVEILRRNDEGFMDPGSMTPPFAKLNPNAAEWSPAATGYEVAESAVPTLSPHEIAVDGTPSLEAAVAGGSTESQKLTDSRNGRRQGKGEGALSTALTRHASASQGGGSEEVRTDPQDHLQSHTRHPPTGLSAVQSGTTPPGKRGNANHLLNFRYEPLHRGSGATRGSSAGRRPSRSPHHPFNRALFLQANFRFLVSDLGDYSGHLRDPDRSLEWSQVAAVEVESAVPPQCPICLETPPLCPQITACGHLFCFPCVVRYLLQGADQPPSHQKQWKKCPLCFATIGTDDLRTVTVCVADTPGEGDLIHFSLMVRSKESTIPFERTSLTPASSLTSLPYSPSGRCHPFSKFSLLSLEVAEAGGEGTEKDLMKWGEAAQEGGGSEEIDHLPFVLACAQLIKERREAWKKCRQESFVSSTRVTQKRLLAQAKAGGEHLKARQTAMSARFGADVSTDADADMARLKAGSDWVYETAFSDEEDGGGGGGSAGMPANRKEGKEGEEVEEKKNPSAEKGEMQGGGGIPESLQTAVGPRGWEGGEGEGEERGYYMFYQASDGRPVILHPLTMRILLNHFGGYPHLPHRLQGRVVEVEAEMQSEGMRKRYRFLSHLPLTATFLLVEVDVGGVVPESSLAPFQAELGQRERRRQRQKHKDLEEQQRAEEASLKLAAGPFLPSADDFSAILAALHDDDVAADVFAQDSSSSPPPPFHVSEAPTPSTLSFSRVAKMGYASGLNAPQLPQGPMGGASPPTRAPWGPPPGWGRGGSPASSVESDLFLGTPPHATPPAGQLSFASVMQGAGAEERGEGEGRGKGKKKGKKGTTVLMSTSARRY